MTTPTRAAAAATAVVAGLTVAAASAALLAAPTHDAEPASAPATAPVTVTATAPVTTLNHKHTDPPPIIGGRPLTLDLPALDVSAPVVPIGSTGGTLTPPSDYTTVGWWSAGTMPGDGGTTIVTGHTVHTGGGALDDLGDMQPGDTVTVERARQDVTYVVSTVRTYRKGTLAAKAADVFTQDGPERLAVVTCGDWNGTVYLSNVVVIGTDPQPAGDGR